MFKSYGITIRPKIGIDDNLLKKIDKSLDSFDHHFIVAEKEGVERHIHAQIWNNVSLRKGDLKKKLTRICEKEEWWDVYHKRYCIDINICYNDWLDNYCIDNETKGDPVEIISRGDPELTEIYYPSKKEQEFIINKSRSKNLKYFELKHKLINDPLYIQEYWEFNHTAKWVLDQMYQKDELIIIECHKRRKEFIKSFHWYLVGKCHVSNGLAGDDLLKYNMEYGN